MTLITALWCFQSHFETRLTTGPRREVLCLMLSSQRHKFVSSHSGAVSRSGAERCPFRCYLPFFGDVLASPKLWPKAESLSAGRVPHPLHAGMTTRRSKCWPFRTSGSASICRYPLALKRRDGRFQPR